MDMMKKVKTDLESKMAIKAFDEKIKKLMYYYVMRFEDIIKIESVDKFEHNFSQLFHSQLFNGYFIAEQLLTSPDTNIPNDWFKQSSSMRKEQIFLLLQDIFGETDIYTSVKTDESQVILMYLLNEYEGIYDLTKQCIIDFTVFGFEERMEDERINRNITLNASTLSSLILPLDDFLYIQPDKFLINTLVKNDVETVGIMYSSFHYTKRKFIGEIIFIKQPEIESLSIKISLRNVLTQKEKDNLVSEIIKLCKEKQDTYKYVYPTIVTEKESYIITN